MRLGTDLAPDGTFFLSPSPFSPVSNPKIVFNEFALIIPVSSSFTLTSPDSKSTSSCVTPVWVWQTGKRINDTSTLCRRAFIFGRDPAPRVSHHASPAPFCAPGRGARLNPDLLGRLFATKTSFFSDFVSPPPEPPPDSQLGVRPGSTDPCPDTRRAPGAPIAWSGGVAPDMNKKKASVLYGQSVGGMW